MIHNNQPVHKTDFDMPRKRKGANLGIVRKNARKKLNEKRAQKRLDASQSPTRATVTTNTETDLLSPMTDSTSSLTGSARAINYEENNSTSESEASWASQYHQRIAILQVFTHHLNSPPEEDDKDTVSKSRRSSQLILMGLY